MIPRSSFTRVNALKLNSTNRESKCNFSLVVSMCLYKATHSASQSLEAQTEHRFLELTLCFRKRWRGGWSCCRFVPVVVVGSLPNGVVSDALPSDVAIVVVLATVVFLSMLVQLQYWYCCSSSCWWCYCKWCYYSRWDLPHDRISMRVEVTITVLAFLIFETQPEYISQGRLFAFTWGDNDLSETLVALIDLDLTIQSANALFVGI